AWFVSSPFVVLNLRPRVAALFPYTTLFRSSTRRAPMRPRRRTTSLPVTIIAPAGLYGSYCTAPLLTSLIVSRKRANIDHTDDWIDRKSTRLNSSHVKISYAVFCLKKKKKY